MTLEDYAVQVYLPYLTDIKEAKPSTLGSYKSMLEHHIFPALGFKRLCDVDPRDIERFLISLKDTSTKYKRNIVLLMQGMFNYAIDSGVLSANPVRRHHKPPLHRQEKPVWTAKQVRAILDALPEEYRPVFQIAALTGFRLGEILGLRREDIDMNQRQIHVRHSLWRKQLSSTKTTASQRDRPFGDELARIFYQMFKRREYKPGDFLFTKNGKPLCPDTLRRDVLYPTLASLGLPRPKRASGFHAFRHTFGSLVLAQTGNLKLVQKLMGHASIQTTGNIYTHIYDEDEKRAVEEVELLVQSGKLNGNHDLRPSVAGAGFEPATFGL